MFKTPIKREFVINPSPKFWLGARKIIFALILFCFIFYPLAAGASTIADKQRELNNLKNQIKEHQNIIGQKQQEAQNLANAIAILDGQIKEAELVLEATKLEIDKTSDEIALKEQELIRQRKILNESLRLMYEEKETSLLETLLSSKSFSSVLDRVEYLNVVKNKIDTTIQSIEKIKSELESKKAILEILKKQQEAQAFYLNSEKAEKDKLLAETKGQEELYQQKVASEKSQARQVATDMARMEEAAKNRGYYNSPPSPFGFSWPTESHRISCVFGNACYSGHTGIDVGGSSGTPIYAAADGVVESVRADATGYEYRSYGNKILINHGSGFESLYAHLMYGGVLVNSGQRVARGQQIGLMGKTGWTFPYPPGAVHLHFEIRYNGTPVNPEPYLP